MKTLYSVLLLVLLAGISSPNQAIAQDCSSFDDCYKKAKDHRKYEGSITLLTKAIKFAKKDKEQLGKAYYLRGKYRYKLIKGEDKKAIKACEMDLEASLENNPSYYWAKDYLINLYLYKQKDYKKAKKYIDNLLIEEPDNAYLHYEYGAYYGVTTQYNKRLEEYKIGYDLIVENKNSAKEVSKWDLAAIVQWYIYMFRYEQGKLVYDSETLALLEKGAAVLPGVSYIHGELAQAQFDNNQTDKALITAKKTFALETKGEEKSPGALFVMGYDDFINFDYKSAANKFERAIKNRKKKQSDKLHPAYEFYYNASRYETLYYGSNDNWKNAEGSMKEGLKKAIELSKGTSYESLIPKMEEYLAKVEEHSNELARRIGLANAKYFDEFRANFSQLPNGYTLDYNTLTGRDISGLRMIDHYFPRSSNYSAIGLVAKGSAGYVFLIMNKDVRSAYLEQIDFVILITDAYGNLIEKNTAAYSQIDNGQVSVKGWFKLSTDGVNYKFDCQNETVYNGELKQWTVEGNCNE